MSPSNQFSIRFKQAIARLGGDVGLLQELAAITSADLPDVIAMTEFAIEEEQIEVAASRLHKLKGMLSTFETRGVTTEVEKMFCLAQQGQIVETKQRFQENKADLTSLMAEIAEIADAT